MVSSIISVVVFLSVLIVLIVFYIIMCHNRINKEKEIKEKRPDDYKIYLDIYKDLQLSEIIFKKKK